MRTDDKRALAYDCISRGVSLGLLHNSATDVALNGRTLLVDGSHLLNFGSCSYLGLEKSPRMIEAAMDAAARFGTQFSSSRAYMSSPQYAEAEQLYSELFNYRPALMCPTTTLGHIATIPVVVERGEVLVVDRQVHDSVQTAAALVRSTVRHFHVLDHSDISALDELLSSDPEFLAADRVWYALDGLYSMNADFAPVQLLEDLMERHRKLWLYVDDAHSVSWLGPRGSGYALENFAAKYTDRMVIAASLAKSFGAGGAIISFPNVEMRERVFTIGGPMIFSGPVQPPVLAAAAESARMHLEGDVDDLRRSLVERIDLFADTARSLGLSSNQQGRSPIQFIPVGPLEATFQAGLQLRDLGFYVNFAIYPAVPLNSCGIRVTLTTHLTLDDVGSLLEGAADAIAVSEPSH